MLEGKAEWLGRPAVPTLLHLPLGTEKHPMRAMLHQDGLAQEEWTQAFMA